MKLRFCLAWVLALALLLSLTACSGKGGESSSSESGNPPSDGEYPVELRGTLIQAQPMRVVSLSPALTEILFAMGLDHYLEGVSDYCDTPDTQALAELPRCGTAQSPDFEAIGKAGAKLVLSTAGLTEADLTALQQMDVDVLVLPRASNLDELKAVYVDLARALEGDHTGGLDGGEYWGSFQGRLDGLAQRGEDYADSQEKAPTVIFLRILDFTMATGDTFENKLLELLSLENLAAPYGEWTFPSDQSASLTPDLIISHSDITIPVLEQNALYKGTQAVIHDRVVTVDMTAFERQTPRMLDELSKIADFLFGPEEDASREDGSSQESSGEGEVI